MSVVRIVRGCQSSGRARRDTGEQAEEARAEVRCRTFLARLSLCVPCERPVYRIAVLRGGCIGVVSRATSTSVPALDRETEYNVI